MEHSIGDEVWVVDGGEIVKGIVRDKGMDRSLLKTAYDVRLDRGHKYPSNGFTVYSGLLGHQVHKDRLSAAKELYHYYAQKHHTLGLALQDCIAHFHDPDYIITRLQTEAKD